MNPLVRARQRLGCTPEQLASRLHLNLHTLLNAEAGALRKVPRAYYDHQLLPLSAGQEYQDFRRSKRNENFPDRGVVRTSDALRQFLDSKQLSVVSFARAACIPEDEVFRALSSGQFSITLEKFFDGQ